MLIRAAASCATLVLALLLSPNASAAPACAGAGCRAVGPQKPLDIMQFMREQAASTRAAKPKQGTSRPSAKAQRPAHRAIAARPKPAPMPAEAAASFAARPEQNDRANVQVVAGDEANAVDRAADTAPAETTGAAVASGPIVQVVDALELNDIDRKADDRPFSGNTRRDGDAQTNAEQASASWLQWIWSALASTLAALATAVHQLIRL